MRVDIDAQILQSSRDYKPLPKATVRLRAVSESAERPAGGIRYGPDWPRNCRPSVFGRLVGDG